MSVDPVDAFIARWLDVTAPELATAQSFGIELRRLADILTALSSLGRTRRMDEIWWMG